MTNREKLEKVIKGLECCIVDNNEPCNCPYCGDGGCIGSLMRDALALLKAQGPRVMTLEEALNSLVIEYRSGKLQEVGKLVFTKGFEYYGNLWRVWDRIPTDQQRGETPWQQ